jgi:hypothetical protein
MIFHLQLTLAPAQKPSYVESMLGVCQKQLGASWEPLGVGWERMGAGNEEMVLIGYLQDESILLTLSAGYAPAWVVGGYSSPDAEFLF